MYIKVPLAIMAIVFYSFILLVSESVLTMLKHQSLQRLNGQQIRDFCQFLVIFNRYSGIFYCHLLWILSVQRICHNLIYNIKPFQFGHRVIVQISYLSFLSWIVLLNSFFLQFISFFIEASHHPPHSNHFSKYRKVLVRVFVCLSCSR